MITHFFKLQSVFIILLILLGYTYNSSMSEQLMDLNNNISPDVYNAKMQQLISSYLSFPFIMMMIIGCISATISVNFVPIYMDVYHNNDGMVTFQNILNKYKENVKNILLLLLTLIILFIPIYILITIATIISLITIVGWIFVLGFCLSYFNQIWYYSIHYKTTGFRSLKNTFSIFKDHFFKITGATALLGLIFSLAYYIIVFGIIYTMSDSTSIEALANNPTSFYGEEFTGIMMVIQLLGLFVGSIVMLLIYTQQGIIFYSRINAIDLISELEDINSIGNSKFIKD